VRFCGANDRGERWIGNCIMRIAAMFLMLATHCAFVKAQAIPTAQTQVGLNGFVTFGGMKTKVGNYVFNSLGVNGGISSRLTSRLDLQFRGGTYPIHARFVQSPFTAGIKFGSRSVTHPQLFAFVGAGASKAHDAGPHYVALPAKWSRCWQISQGLDLPAGRVKWRVYEVTWTETYTPLRSLRSISVNTGMVYSFGH
jgi:hypothetical protein